MKPEIFKTVELRRATFEGRYNQVMSLIAQPNIKDGELCKAVEKRIEENLQGLTKRMTNLLDNVPLNTENEAKLSLDKLSTLFRYLAEFEEKILELLRPVFSKEIPLINQKFQEIENTFKQCKCVSNNKLYGYYRLLISEVKNKIMNMERGICDLISALTYINKFQEIHKEVDELAKGIQPLAQESMKVRKQNMAYQTLTTLVTSSLEILEQRINEYESSLKENKDEQISKRSEKAKDIQGIFSILKKCKQQEQLSIESEVNKFKREFGAYRELVQNSNSGVFAPFSKEVQDVTKLYDNIDQIKEQYKVLTT